MKKNKSKRVIRESEFHFYEVPPEKLKLNQETIDSVRRWHEFSLRTGRNTQNAAILDDLCDEILDAWEGDYPATAALKKDVERAKRTHLGGLGRYLNGLVRIGELILNEDPTFTESKKTMKKLNITKEQFNRSNYFQNKYGKLEYVSESGKLFKTDTGKVLKFVEESYSDFFGVPGVEDRGWVIIYQGCKIEPDALWEELGDMYEKEHPEDSTMKHFEEWCDQNTDTVKAVLDDFTRNVDDTDDFGNPVEEGIRKELVPQNGRQSFGHKAAEEEDEDGFTLFSYNTPVARLERSDDGSHLDFILLNDYLSGTTMNHIHSFLISHKQEDIPSKKLKMMQVGDKVPLMAAESRKKLAKESENHRYSIKFVKKGWDCSVQEDAPSEEEAIAIAVDKGKIKSPKDVVKVTDLGVPGSYWKESKKLVKEGAGAGYTVEIKNFKIGELIGFEWKTEKDGGDYVEAKFKVVPGTYEIGASDYYNDFFWQEHEIGVTPDAMIDSGIITVEYSPDYYRKNYEDPDFRDYDGREIDIERELQRQIHGEYDISFDWGAGWTHANLPDTMDLTDVDVDGEDIYWMITRLQLEAGDLAAAVNSGYQSTFDQGEDEEEEDGEQVNESDDTKSIKVIVRLLRPRKGEKPWKIEFTDGTSEEYETQSEVWDRMDELGEEFAGRDRVGRDWDFISTRRKTDESTKKVNEVSGWDLEDEDLTLVNSESDGDKLYIVKLWWGSGYQMDCYNAYAFDEEEALNYVVAYIDKTDPESLNAVDENAESYKRELVADGEASDEMEAEENPYFQETFLWVDATTEGASQAHYIYAENLAIAEYPKDHDYPMSKDVKRR